MEALELEIPHLFDGIVGELIDESSDQMIAIGVVPILRKDLVVLLLIVSQSLRMLLNETQEDPARPFL